MNKKMICIYLILFFAVTSLFAQSADKIDEILESNFLSKGQACYLIGSIIGNVEEQDSFQVAFDKFKAVKMFKNGDANENIRLDEFSALVLGNIKMKNSFCFIVTKSPYYALRHLKKLKLVPNTHLAKQSVKPLYALNMLSRISQGGF